MTSRDDRLSDLFIPSNYTPPYPTERSELEAVADGRKGMSVTSFLSSDIDSDADSYSEFRSAAAGLGLCVVLHAAESSFERRFDRTYVFALRTSELWRVPAYLTLMSVMRDGHGWSRGQDHALGLVLGYSEPQIKAWIEEQERLGVFGGGRALYFSIPKTWLEEIETLGRRAFPRTTDLSQLTAVFPSPGFVLRLDTKTSNNGIARLARAAASEHLLKKLFPDPSSFAEGLSHASFKNVTVRELNEGLLTPLQML